ARPPSNADSRRRWRSRKSAAAARIQEAISEAEGRRRASGRREGTVCTVGSTRESSHTPGGLSRIDLNPPTALRILRQGNQDGRRCRGIGEAEIEITDAGQAQHEARHLDAAVGTAGPGNALRRAALDFLQPDLFSPPQPLRTAENSGAIDQGVAVASAAVTERVVGLAHLGAAAQVLERGGDRHLRLLPGLLVAGKLPGPQTRQADTRRAVAPGGH